MFGPSAPVRAVRPERVRAGSPRAARRGHDGLRRRGRYASPRGYPPEPAPAFRDGRRAGRSPAPPLALVGVVHPRAARRGGPAHRRLRGRDFLRGHRAERPVGGARRDPRVTRHRRVPGGRHDPPVGHGRARHAAPDPRPALQGPATRPGRGARRGRRPGRPAAAAPARRPGGAALVRRPDHAADRAPRPADRRQRASARHGADHHAADGRDRRDLGLRPGALAHHFGDQRRDADRPLHRARAGSSRRCGGSAPA